MPKILSDNTAKWLQQQTHSRNIASKRRDTSNTSSVSYPVFAVVAEIRSVISPGIYSIKYETKTGSYTTTTEIAATLMNSLISGTEYAPGDKILVHHLECSAIVGEERTE